MKVNSIIFRYMLKEMIPPFFISIAFFLFIFLMTTILEITNYIVNYQISVIVFFQFLLFTMPLSLQFVIPMSVMISILLTLLRMSSDNEVVALKASGVGIYALLPSVLVYCTIGCLLTAYMAIYGVPWGRVSMQLLKNEVIASSFEIGLKEKTFVDAFKNVMLYVNRIDADDNRLVDIFIEDKRSDNLVSTVVAPEGKLLSEPERLYFRLRLFNGIINQVSIKDKTVNSISFDTYDISLDVRQALRRRKGRSKHRLEMSLDEMREYLRETDKKNVKYYRTLMEYYNKFSIPVACFALGLLALPLGFQSSVTKRSYGLVLGLIFFIVYYVLLTAAKGYGELGKFPPLIGMWLPNIVFGGLAIFLIARTGEERPALIDYWYRLMDRVWRRSS